MRLYEAVTNDGLHAFNTRFLSLVPMDIPCGRFVARMDWVLAKRKGQKKSFETTASRLSDELGRDIVVGSGRSWWWASRENKASTQGSKDHPTGRVKNNGAVGKTASGVGKGGSLSKAAHHGGPSPLVETESVSLAEAVEHTFGKVAKVGFPGDISFHYDHLFTVRKPKKSVSQRLINHYRKESQEWRTSRQRRPITAPTI